MKFKLSSVRLGFAFAMIPAALAFCQSTELIPDPSSTTPSAFVYVQTSHGVVAYAVSAAGRLTLVHGSPFAVSGQMEGITGSHLLSVGTTILHSYEIKSNGAVGNQVSTINTADHSGGPCGPTTGNQAILDHSGKYFYVQLSSEDAGCGNSEWQTYKIGSDGDFTFIGNYLPEYASPTTPPIFNSSDKYAYGFVQLFLDGQDGIAPFTRLSSGDLSDNSSFTEHDPAPDPSLPYYLQPYLATADPHEHLAVLMTPCYNGGPCSPYPVNTQLASYTIDTTTGGISSTNTQATAPFTQMRNPSAIDMSPDGKFVAVSGSGVQVFNFNGAALPTELAPVRISGVSIDRVTWDNADHLYALSYGAHELYVFNVSTARGVVEIGEPIVVPGAYGLTGIIVARR
jgi:hypothetical protein